MCIYYHFLIIDECTSDLFINNKLKWLFRFVDRCVINYYKIWSWSFKESYICSTLVEVVICSVLGCGKNVKNFKLKPYIF